MHFHERSVSVSLRSEGGEQRIFPAVRHLILEAISQQLPPAEPVARYSPGLYRVSASRLPARRVRRACARQTLVVSLARVKCIGSLGVIGLALLGCHADRCQDMLTLGGRA